MKLMIFELGEQLHQKDQLSQWYHKKLKELIDGTKSNQRIMRLMSLYKGQEYGQKNRNVRNLSHQNANFDKKSMMDNAQLLKKKQIFDKYSLSFNRKKEPAKEVEEQKKVFNYKTIHANIETLNADYIDPNEEANKAII